MSSLPPPGGFGQDERMATWDWRGPAGERQGLTIYQLQQFVSAGQALAEDEVRLDGGDWIRLGDEPSLARFLPATAAVASAGRTMVINGVVLELDENGKPLPPPPDLIARLLVQDSDSDRRAAQIARVRKATLWVAFFLFAGISVLLVRLLSFRPE